MSQIEREDKNYFFCDHRKLIRLRHKIPVMLVTLTSNYYPDLVPCDGDLNATHLHPSLCGQKYTATLVCFAASSWVSVLKP
jgi:hypothetical protein